LGLRRSGATIDTHRMNQEMDIAERALAEFRRDLKALGPEEIDLVAIERRVQELTNRVGLELMREVLCKADTKAPEVLIEGEVWGNRREHAGTYTTSFGDVTMLRSVYQRSGRGRVAVPVELRLGMVEGRYTPRMARILTRAVGLMPETEAEQFLSEVGVAMVSVSTLHRVPRAIAARYETRREVIEQAIRERDPIPTEAVTMQVSLDGVMVPMDGEYAGARGRKTDSPAPSRHEQRYGVREQDVPADGNQKFGRAFHEGSVATVAFFDVEGHRLKTTYLARMPEANKTTLVAQLNAEVQSVVAERPELNICFASDGAESQWHALKGIEARLPEGCTGHRMDLTDLFHVSEYLQLAATGVHPKSEAEAKALADSWRETLKERDDGATKVLASMLYYRRKLPKGNRRKQLNKALRYIIRQHRRGRTRYAEAKRRNYPVGTGITEAAAKTVVNTRMKRAGARYEQHGGQTIMLFRAAILSNRFDALHEELHSTYTARIAA
jgi:hypothetical protein